jgi:hypothetical protein
MSEFDLEVGGVGVGCELPLEELWVRTVGHWDASYVAEGCIIGAVGLSPRTIREISTRLYSGEKLRRCERRFYGAGTLFQTDKRSF